MCALATPLGHSLVTAADWCSALPPNGQCERLIRAQLRLCRLLLLQTECAELPMPASASVRLEVAQTGEAPQCCDLAQAEVADRVVKMTISARNIWNKYFKRAALMHVRFDSKTVDEVAFRLDSNNATACMFMGAKEEVLAHMRSLHTLFVVDALMTVALPKAVLA